MNFSMLHILGYANYFFLIETLIWFFKYLYSSNIDTFSKNNIVFSVFKPFIYRLFFRGIVKGRFVGIKCRFIWLKGRFRRIKRRFVISWFSSCFVWMQNSCAEGLVLSYLSGFGAFSIGLWRIYFVILAV